MSSFISQFYVLAAKESTKVIGRLESLTKGKKVRTPEDNEMMWIMETLHLLSNG